MKQRAILFFFIGIMTGILQAQTLTLKDAGQLFLKQNLSLIAARYDMDIAQAQVLQARLFENPVISLEQNVYNRLNGKYFDMGKDGESGVEIEQVISIAGQRSNRIRLEKVNKEMAGYQFQEIMRTLHSELNERFVETYFLTRNMAVYEKEITSLERLLAEMKLQQQKGNISLMEASRLEAMSQLEKAMNLYQSVDSDLEQNFEKLIAGVNETFRKRSISLLEFIDYYESYKETCIQLYDTRKDLLLAMENLNRVIGQNVFNY